MRDDGQIARSRGCRIKRSGGDFFCAYLSLDQFQERAEQSCCRSSTIFFRAELFGLRCSRSRFLEDTALSRQLIFMAKQADRQLSTRNSRAGWSRLRASLSPPWAPFISPRRCFCRSSPFG